MNSKPNLIDSLVKDLAATRPAVSPNFQALMWFAISAVYVVVATSAIGPLRSNAFAQLLAEPRFLIEMLIGLAAILVLSFGLFQSAVPGMLTRRLTWMAGGLLAMWVASYIVGLLSPTLEPSMLGKRPHCFVETIILALPPLLLAIWSMRRLFPLNPARSAMAAGLTAGMFPALYMQIACMYDPAHILAFHIVPGVLVAVVGLILGRLLRVSSIADNQAER